MPKRGISTQKQKKWTASLNSAYSNYSSYQISASTDNFGFLEQICPKRVFLLKNQKNEHHHWILHVRISVGAKFQLKVTILMFWTEFAHKGYFHSKTKKNEHHHWILHVRISLGTKFQLKMTILIFWTKFAQKGYFHWKTKKMNSIIEFWIFELV